MGEKWDQDPNENLHTSGETPRQDDNNIQTPPPSYRQDDIDKRIEDIKRIVIQGASEAQARFKRAVDNASTYFQQSQMQPSPRQASSVEEHHIRQLVNTWSNENWRVARELGTYMDIVSWSTDELWEAVVQTRWEVRNMEVITEPYSGRSVAVPQPILPVWDYELPEVVGLKPPMTRTRMEGRDEIVSCTSCNGTGHVLCSACTGKGWVVCPDCKGRTKKRCVTCRGRGYVADWTATPKEKKAFLRKQAENVANSVGGKVSEVFDNIRQQGVPIPNPLDSDPASKGPTIPCPDCINGEVECTCGNGKRVCTTCQGARMSICNGCNGTGKLVRHREMVRRFDLHSQTRFVGESPIPAQQLVKANGELVYNAEINETLYPAVAPERVPLDVWQVLVELAQSEGRAQEKPGVDPQSSGRSTLQVVELVRIPYTKVQYRYSDQDYVLYIYDCEGEEKFYADRHPARWDRIERLVKAISSDLVALPQHDTPPQLNHASGYRVPVEVPPYNITEEEDDDDNYPDKQS